MSLIADGLRQKNDQISSHSELFEAISLSGANFLAARERLEAMLLLETFVKESYDFGPQYLYQIRLPLTPQLFFAEPLFSGLLLVKIGALAYDKLVSSLGNNSEEEKKDFQKISKKFNEVYHLDLSILNQEDQRIHGATQAFTKSETDFNFAFFRALMKNDNLHFKIGEHAESILVALHALFGLSELELFQKAVSLARSGDVIDLLELKRVLEQQAIVKSSAEQKNCAQQKATFEDTDLTTCEQQVVKEACNLSPVDYLMNIRQQKGGFVAPDELLLLEELQKKFSQPSAINILINYVLIIKENSTLSRNYVLKIANDWLQHGVVDALSAITQIKKLTESYRINSPRTDLKRRKASTKVEKVPEYFNHQRQIKKANPDDVKKIAEELKKISSFGEDRNG
jgi:replication initiation and membrane attachment protein